MRGLRQAAWTGRVALVAITTLALVVVGALPSGAVLRPGLPAPTAPRAGNTQLILSATGPGQSVSGFIANPNSSFDPVSAGYPRTNPGSDFTPKDEDFAGVIFGTPVGGGPDISLYCIDIETDTFVGHGYQLGTWDEANVPNVGYVARILNEYYPSTDEPKSLDTNQKAAAVQAAIWFFSDRYVLNTSEAIHGTVAAIADAVIAQGPIVSPPPPSLGITPTELSGAPASVLGPFTMTSTASTTVTATGANMFSDSAGTVPIHEGATVPSGQKIWLRSTSPPAAVLQATAVATVPTGNVYLYDGGATAAQKLVLGTTATLTTTVSATAYFQPTGTLVVKKTIGGPAAGHQGQVVITAQCDGTPLTPTFIIPGGRPAGEYSRTYDFIPAGATCIVTETSNGHNSTVTATVTGDGQPSQPPMVPADGTATAALTDTYDFVTGSLTVNKEIGGAAAGHQGPVTIHVICGNTALSPDWTIPSGAAAGSYSHTWGGIQGESSCIVDETANGATNAVWVTTVVSPRRPVLVGAGQNAQVNIDNTYGFIWGSLVVTKTIAGPAAGHQGQVIIKVSCAGTELSPLVVMAGKPAGSYSETYTDIPPFSTCSAVETADGSSNAVSVMTDVGKPVMALPGETTPLLVTNTYTFPTGSLVVSKNSIGLAAGHQGQVTISVSCEGVGPLPDFIVPAGQIGYLGQVYNDIPGGSTCTVRETVDGSTSTVSVTTVGGNQTVPVEAGRLAYADVTNTYDFKPGSLTVTKTITGPGAGQQGAVTITVTCESGDRTTTLEPPFVIPAGSTGTPTPTHTYHDIPAGSKCTVIEGPDGSNTRVAAVKEGSGITVTILPGETVTVPLTDTYETGVLVISKTITGPAAGQQGEVVIHTVCNPAASTPDFVIDAHAPDDTYQRTYSGILAGSTCTVTETADGATSTVKAVTEGSPQTVPISANGSGSASLTDRYDFLTGSVRIIKTIAGAAAGHQGQVTIELVCDGAPWLPAIQIPEGTPASDHRFTYSYIPAGSVCRASETADGSNSAVNVVTSGDLGKDFIVEAGQHCRHPGQRQLHVLDRRTHGVQDDRRRPGRGPTGRDRHRGLLRR